MVRTGLNYNFIMMNRTNIWSWSIKHGHVKERSSGAVSDRQTPQSFSTGSVTGTVKYSQSSRDPIASYLLITRSANKSKFLTQREMMTPFLNSNTFTKMTKNKLAVFSVVLTFRPRNGLLLIN